MRPWQRRAVQIGRDPRRSPARPAAHSRLSCEIRWLLMMLPGSGMGLSSKKEHKGRNALESLLCMQVSHNQGVMSV